MPLTRKGPPPHPAGSIRRRRLLRAVGAGAIVSAGAGCASAPLPARPRAAGAAAGAIRLVARDWHTDVALAAGQLGAPLDGLAAEWPGAVSLVLGFGDRAWLLHGDRSIGAMLAALLPGPGAMLVTGLSVPPEEAFGADSVVALRVTADGLARLRGFLAASLDLDAAGRPMALAEGPYRGSRFYASRLTYSLAYTCNTWTAEALARAGLPVPVTGMLLAGQVMTEGRAAAAAAQP